MTSNPPAQCCIEGVKHDGTASGEMKAIGQTSTYLSYPKDGSTENAVIIFTDIIGHKFINVQLVADQLAANGYLTVVPDLFHGDPVPWQQVGKINLMDWLHGPPGHMPDRVDPVVQEVIKELRGPLGCTRIGGVGYCFGAKYVIRFLKEGHLDAGFVAHPSFVEVEELEAVQKPLSIAAAELDTRFSAEKRHETEKILEKLDVAYQLTLYSDVEHGFGCRVDLSSRRKKFAKEQAFLQAVHWFSEYVHLSSN